VKLSPLGATFAVCRLDPHDAIPDWARGAFVSITRTADELSIVCEERHVPDGVRAERGWSAFKVDGPIPFEVTGVAASITAALAAEDISVFLVATFDTDYVLVKTSLEERAARALARSGHEIA
jgi:uncharacterized protein